MDVYETLIRTDAEHLIHPIGGRIYLLPPSLIRLLYNGNSMTLHVSARRSLEPLVLGLMAMNLVVGKRLDKPYPSTLIDPILWRPALVPMVKNLVCKEENGLEASLRSLEPANFVYLRASTTPAGRPCLYLSLEETPTSSTLNVQLSSV